MIAKEKFCERCGKPVTACLVRNLTTNRISQVYWQCPEGHAINKTPKWIPHQLVKQFVDIETLPVVQDYSSQQPCVICGEPGELHHWAPRHLFRSDADQWPQSYLCHYHHTLWHQRVTPDMCARTK